MRHSTLLTEFTDISQRLEYLVAHSSQMIFVTGEDLAIQQGFVEAFLGQQSSYANVAFLTARRGKSAQYYRQQLAEQLHIDEPKNKLTLAQQFASRPDKKEPVIIAMTSAEHTPEEVLRELWDLVLQNRFTRNGEQINILMFGDQEWAEEVKSWLPTNNNDKPVLLTTQTLEYDEETEVEGDLDEMIANRRKLFKERMKSRAQSSDGGDSMLRHWWMKLLLVGVFLVSFASILIWQYFDVTKNALQEFTQFIFQQAPVAKTTSGEISAGLTLEEALVLEQDNNNLTQAQDNGNQRVAENFTQAMNRLEALGTKNRAEQREVIDTSVNVQVNETADSPNSVTIAEISTEQLIQLRDGGEVNARQNNDTQHQIGASGEPENNSTVITNTDFVIEELPTDPKQVELQESIFEAIMALEAMESESPPGVTQPEAGFQQVEPLQEASLQAQSATQVSIPAQNTGANTGAAQGSQTIQTATPEAIVEETQAPFTSETVTSQAQLNTQALQANSSVQDYQVQDNTGANNAVAASTDYQFHEQLLLELPNDSYVLQLSGITTLSLLEEYLVDNRMLNSVWVYKTQRYGGDWFVVLFNQNFDSLEAARSGVSLLSTELQSAAPFAKSISQIKNEILSD